MSAPGQGMSGHGCAPGTAGGGCTAGSAGVVPGKVWLVGAGPGAPDLLTLRAARLLEEADIVLYDALVHPDTLALAERARKVAVGKRCGSVSTDQRFINRALVEAARQHARVVRLKGGDPMLFGRAQEEIDALVDAAIEFEVVPGVTAALAAASEMRVPLTRRGVSRSVTFATARTGPGQRESDWVRAARHSDTTVLYMGAEHAPEIGQVLVDAGVPADMPVAVVERASLPDARSRRATLADLAGGRLAGILTPAVLCIGRVFAAEDEASVLQTAGRAPRPSPADALAAFGNAR